MKTSVTLFALARTAVSVLCDALSPPACAACDQPIPSRQVFCAECAATVVRDESQTNGSITFARFGGAVAMALKRFKYEERADLARAVAQQLDIPFAPRALARCRQTAQQARLGRAERLENMADAFDVRNKSAVALRSVLLVDDVLTTGATLLACRQALARAGARDVMSVCLARSGRD